MWRFDARLLSVWNFGDRVLRERRAGSPFRDEGIFDFVRKSIEEIRIAHSRIARWGLYRQPRTPDALVCDGPFGSGFDAITTV